MAMIFQPHEIRIINQPAKRMTPSVGIRPASFLPGSRPFYSGFLKKPNNLHDFVSLFVPQIHFFVAL